MAIGLLETIASEATVVADASLVRIWVMGPGDNCSHCAMAPECPDRSRCLHLTASAGLTSRLDGPFRRFPLGARQVGGVVRSAEALILTEGLASSGLAEPGWLALHRIRSFGAWPLLAKDEVAGVLALFSRRVLNPEGIRAIEALARVAAFAIHAVDAVAPNETRAPREPSPLVHAPEALPPTMAEAQRRAILEALRHSRGRVSGPGGAAEILGMKSTTLESRIRRLGLRKPPRVPAPGSRPS